jgi:hypothetical protein
MLCIAELPIANVGFGASYSDYQMSEVGRKQPFFYLIQIRYVSLESKAVTSVVYE